MILLLIPMLPPLLEELTLYGDELNDACFTHIPRQCPHLTSVSLRYASITNESIALLSRLCPQLKRISLYCCDDLSPKVFGVLAASPLERLHIYGIPLEAIDQEEDEQVEEQEEQEYDSVIDYETDTVPNVIQALVHFSGLTSLELGHVNARFNRYLMPAVITPMDGGNYLWPNLTTFELDGGAGIQDKDIITLIKTHPHLKELGFCGNSISDDLLDFIADTLPGLTSLDLANGLNFTMRGLRRVIMQCPLLTYVGLGRSNLTRKDFPDLDPPTAERIEQCLGIFDLANQLSELKERDLELIRHAWADNNN